MVSATRAAKDPDWAFVPLGAVFLSLSEMWHMSKPVKKVFRFSNFWVILETCPNLWWRSCSKCYAIDCFGIHTWNMSKPLMTFVFKVLRNRLLRYMSKPVMTFVFKVLRNRLLRYTYLKHVQTCDDVRVQSATQSTASVYTLETCPNLWWRSCSKCYAIDYFGTCPNLWWRSCSKCYAIDCFGIHTWNMSKPVMTFVFKVLRNRLLRYTYLQHVQTCDDVRVQSATQSTASVYILETCPNLWWRSCSKCYAIDCFGIHTWNMSKPVMTFVVKVLRNRLLRYILETCPWSHMLCNPVKRCISCT